MTNLDPDQITEFFCRYHRFGGTDPSFIELLGNDELMKWLVESLNQKCNANPFEISVVESLERLRVEFDQTFCPRGAKEPTSSDLTHLERMAPDWPKGNDVFRGIRVRPTAFGDGRDGMITTFEAHCAAVKRVHPKFWRWELFLSGVHQYQGKDVERLRLLGGNERHKPALEWFVADLSVRCERESITSVRSVHSLGDEGFSLAWMFPGRVEAIEYNKKPAWFCAGYELNVPEIGDESWQGVPCVCREDLGGGTTAGLGADWRGNGDAGFSVPLLRE
ncbi:TPA: hypothetical protein DCW61_05165 [Candidatus Uhrbacteria bacterium]|nr:hypothetical protein [Candidatus Uhrbacteria bacterium]